MQEQSTVMELEVIDSIAIYTVGLKLMKRKLHIITS